MRPPNALAGAGGAGEKYGGEGQGGKALHWCATYESTSQRPLTSFRVAVTWTGARTVGRLERGASARVDVVAALRVVEVNGRRVAGDAGSSCCRGVRR